MAGSSRREAVHAFVGTVQRALRCLVNAHVYVEERGAHRGVLGAVHRPWNAILSPGRAAAISVEHYFTVDHGTQAGRDWSVEIVGYTYLLFLSPTPATAHEREVLAYHFHPLETPGVPFPHAHVRWDLNIQGKSLARAHLVTGYVSLGEFLRMLVRDFGAKPLVSNWADVLDRTEDHAYWRE